MSEGGSQHSAVRVHDPGANTRRDLKPQGSRRGRVATFQPSGAHSVMHVM